MNKFLLLTPLVASKALDSTESQPWWKFLDENKFQIGVGAGLQIYNLLEFTTSNLICHFIDGNPQKDTQNGLCQTIVDEFNNNTDIEQKINMWMLPTGIITFGALTYPFAVTIQKVSEGKEGTISLWEKVWNLQVLNLALGVVVVLGSTALNVAIRYLYHNDAEDKMYLVTYFTQIIVTSLAIAGSYVIVIHDSNQTQTNPEENHTEIEETENPTAEIEETEALPKTTTPPPSTTTTDGGGASKLPACITTIVASLFLV